MKKTPFSGITVLEPGEGLDTDNGAFIDRDRYVIDRLLQLGAKLHRHTGLDGLSNPLIAPSASIIASGGTIPPELTISIGYTIEDGSEGETEISPLAVTSTGTPLSIPPAAPSAEIDYTAGELLTNTYYYALTWLDGEGGETPAGPVVGVERAPGYANAQVKLSNLTYGMKAAGAVGWRLYRAIGGGEYDLLTSGNTEQDTFTDDGTTAVDCDINPPGDNENSTRRVNQLRVDLPAGINPAATFINVYGTLSGDFGEASLLGQYPIASAGKSIFYLSLEFLDAMPPDVNLSIGTAHMIDPDTELLDWHWKRPVASPGALPSGVQGDVRLSLSNRKLYAVFGASAASPGEWDELIGGVGSGGSAGVTVMDGIIVPGATEIEFVASGEAQVAVSEPLGGKARVTIYAPAAEGGGGGASGLPGRAWASATVELASGASGLVSLPINALSADLMKIATNRRARVEVYGDTAARAADLPRAIGVDPVGDHGVQLDYANTATPSGAIHRVTPIVNAANLDSPPEKHLYLTVTNYDATGNVVVGFLYLPKEN